MPHNCDGFVLPWLTFSFSDINTYIHSALSPALVSHEDYTGASAEHPNFLLRPIVLLIWMRALISSGHKDE